MFSCYRPSRKKIVILPSDKIFEWPESHSLNSCWRRKYNMSSDWSKFNECTTPGKKVTKEVYLIGRGGRKSAQACWGLAGTHDKDPRPLLLKPYQLPKYCRKRSLPNLKPLWFNYSGYVSYDVTILLNMKFSNRVRIVNLNGKQNISFFSLY